MDTSEFTNVAGICPGAVSRFESFIKSRYNFDDDTFLEFKTLLKASQALISGSSVLHSLFPPEDVSSWSANDLDIYVNAKNFIPLRDFLASKCKHINSPTNFFGKKSNYSHSFFKMNKILKMYTFKFIDDKSSDMDLVMVENSQPIETLIKNYDLSCCMNYYDGETIKSFNLEDTLAKKSKLSPDYFKLMSNTKIKRRINKYKKRGFEIILPENVTSDNPLSSTPNEEDVKRFIINKLFRLIFRLEIMDVKQFGLFSKRNKGHCYDYYYCSSWISFAYNAKIYDKDEDDDYEDDDYEDYDDDYEDYDDYVDYGYNDVTKLKNYIPIPPEDIFFRNDNLDSRHRTDTFDGIDPYEFDCAEKYKKFGEIYVKVFRKVSKILLKLYKEMIKSIDKKFIGDIMRHLSDEENSFPDENGEEIIRIEYVKGEKNVYSDKIKKYINEYIIPSIKYLENFSGEINIASKFTSETLCFDEISYEEVKIKDFLSKKNNIIIKICDNFKGYNRQHLINYYNKNNKIYNGQKLNNEAKEYLADKTIRCYEIIHTGIKNDILIPYSDEKYINKFNL